MKPCQGILVSNKPTPLNLGPTPLNHAPNLVIFLCVSEDRGFQCLFRKMGI